MKLNFLVLLIKSVLTMIQIVFYISTSGTCLPLCPINTDIEGSNDSNSINIVVIDAQSSLLCLTNTNSLTSSVNVENDQHSLTQSIQSISDSNASDVLFHEIRFPCCTY